VACRLNETNTSGTTQNNQPVQVLRKTRSTLSLTPTQGQSELRRTPVTLHDTTNYCHTPGNQRGGYLQPMGHQHNKHNQKLRLCMSWQDVAIDKRPTMALCCKQRDEFPLAARNRDELSAVECRCSWGPQCLSNNGLSYDVPAGAMQSCQPVSTVSSSGMDHMVLQDPQDPQVS
jgi:hypothetical protein